MPPVFAPERAAVDAPTERHRRPSERDARYCPRCSFEIGADATADVPDTPDPGVPGADDEPEVWPDGAGGLEDIPLDTLARELVKRGELDLSDLREE